MCGADITETRGQSKWFGSIVVSSIFGPWDCVTSFKSGHSRFDSSIVLLRQFVPSNRHWFLFANFAARAHYLYMAQVSEELIPTRTTLIHRLKNWQDQSSWQDFFDTYWKLIYDVALKGGLTDTEAQDVVQETIISVAKHMPTFNYDPTIGSFKAWLLNMTRWRITDQFRKRGPVAAYSSSPEETATGTRTMDRLVDPASRDLDALWE